MKLHPQGKSLLLSCICAVLLNGCAAGAADSSDGSGDRTVTNTELQQRVEAAIANASDIPQQFRVETNDGVVRLIGSLQCENCGGNRTPGTAGTIQQSLGAVVRAVPGVMGVEFLLDEGP